MIVTAEDLLPIDRFEKERDAHLRRILAIQEVRRVPLGPAMTVVFENRDTVWWQVQEMIRVERITDPAAVQHELDTYNALLPGPDELSATLLIAYEEPERSVMLRKLVGLDRHLALHLPGDRVVPAVFDKGQFDEERLSSVQFIRFPLGPEGREALADLRHPGVLRCTHPAYQAETVLPPSVRGALVEDLLAAG